MEFSDFEQRVYEIIAKDMGVTPETVRADFYKFSEEVDRLVKKGYAEEEAEMMVATTWVPTYLQ